VYGAGDGWTEAISLALRRWPFFFPIPGDGRVRLQPIWVEDLVSCALACLADPKSARKTFVVGGSQALSYDDFINLIMQVTGRRRTKRYMRPASALSWSRFLRGLLSGYNLYTPTELDLLSVDRTTALDSVSYQFGFTPARPASSMDYLK
jgi:NADH dehydrogenase